MHAASSITPAACKANLVSATRVLQHAQNPLKRPATASRNLISTRLRAIASPSAPETQQSVEQWMTKGNILTVTPDTSIDVALELLVNNRVSGLPVVNDAGVVVGVVSDFDLLAVGGITEQDKSGGLFPVVDNDWNSFFAMQRLIEKNAGKYIRDVMTHDAICVRPTTSIVDAANLLLKMKIHRLPVVDESGRVVGVISLVMLSRLL